MRPLSKRFAWAPWLFLAAAVCLQIQAALALLPSDLLANDPAAHFTTGVMLHDFLKSPNQPPMPFAECFYIRYPKVAFGHWPPVFYIVEAAWFFVFGTKIVAARWMCALIAAWCALLIYRRCAITWGKWHALMAAAAFLWFPAVRHQAWNVMADLLLMAFMFLALGSLCDYLVTEKPRDAVRLAIWTSLAILTKGSGWLLLSPILAGPLVSGRPRIYLRAGYWLALLATLAVSSPFFLWMGSLNLGYPVSVKEYIQRFLIAVWQWPLLVRAGAIAVLIAGAAAAYRFLPRKPLPPAQTMIAILVVWPVTLAAFINAFPVTPEVSRFYLVLLAPGAYVLAGLMAELEGWLDAQHPSYGRLLPVLVYSVGLVVALPTLFVSTTAYSRAVDTIPARPLGPVIVVESDARGEGAIVAARLEHDAARSSYILRGSQFLAESSWSGYRYAPKYQTPDALLSALDSIDADYVILDTTAPPTPDARLLASALQEPNSPWQVTARMRVPIAARSGELLVYRYEPRRPLPRVLPKSVQLGPERGSQTLTCTAY